MRCGILHRRATLGTSITCLAKTGNDVSMIFRTSTNWSTFAAREHRGSAQGARSPRSVPLRVAAPVPEAPAALPGWQAASPSSSSSPVPGHLGVKKTRRLRHPRALDDPQLFAIEGSKSPLKARTRRPTGLSPKTAAKMRQKARSDRLKNIMGLCR